MEKIKILIPTDFTQQADFAWLIVNRLMEKIPAEVHFLHVLETGSNVTFNSKGDLIDDGESDPEILKRLKSIAIEKLANLKTIYGKNIQTHIIPGSRTHSIVKFAEDEEFNLVVMGTKGSIGLREHLSGTETQHVARKSNIPVLSLMCDRSDLEIKNVLWVHDFTSNDGNIPEMVSRIAKAWEAKLHLLQIVHKDKADENQIKERMQEYADKSGLMDIEMHILRDYNVESGVTHFSQMHDMDLIVIGTHGRTGFSQILKGSVAERLINHLFKPVITYHIKPKKND